MDTGNRILTGLTLAVVAMVSLVLASTSANATIIVDGAIRSSPYGAAGSTKHYDFENGDKIDGAGDVIQGKKVFPGTTAATNSPITFDISNGTLNLSQAFGVGGCCFRHGHDDRRRSQYR